MRKPLRPLKKSFPARVVETVSQLALATSIEVWFQDEMRVGQKNSLVYQWAKKGTRPRQPKDQRLPIRLSPIATRASVWPCSWTFTSVAIFGSRNRSQSSGDFFLTTQPCAAYLEKARWSDGFVCPHCQAAAEPFRFAHRPGVLRCRNCRDTGFMLGTVMAGPHPPLSGWFWSAYLMSTQTPRGASAPLPRRLGPARYDQAV